MKHLNAFVTMKIEKKRKLLIDAADAVVLPVFKKGKTSAVFAQYPELEFFFKTHKFKGAPDEDLAVYSGTMQKLLVVIGAGDCNRMEDVVKLAKKTIGMLKKHKVKTALIHFSQDVPLEKHFARVFIDYLYISRYSFDAYKGQHKPENKTKNFPSRVQLYCEPPRVFSAPLLKERETVNAGVTAARNLVNEPPSTANPGYLVEAARKIAAGFNLGIKVSRRKELEESGLKGILAVGHASPHEPALIRLSYSPRGPVKTVALVGKAITFDSGGLNLKPPGAMLDMKSDMGGGAAVLGIMDTAARLELPVAIDAYIPVAENMPGGFAYKPGDIITFANKKSVEIVNTDAEGRLLLADALLMAAKGKPDFIIEMSTLTGSVSNALGDGIAGLMGTNQPLAAMLLKAAENTGERLWQLPLPIDYRESIKGKIADLKNAGYGKASAIKAGLFLTEFTGGLPFAHIDMAGTAFLTKPNSFYPQEGATGFGVRLVLDALNQVCAR